MDINLGKLKEVIADVHKKFLRKKQRINLNEEVVMENEVLNVLCQNPNYSPKSCSEELASKYGEGSNFEKILNIMRFFHLTSNVDERAELINNTGKIIDILVKAMTGDEEAYKEYMSMMSLPAVVSGQKYRVRERLTIVMLFVKYPELNLFGDSEILLNFNNTFSRYALYDVEDSIAYVYGFKRKKTDEEQKTADENKQSELFNLTKEQLISKIEAQDQNLDRISAMLQELQTEFEQKIEESKAQELADFFSKLNSDKYGFILDEMLGVRKGIDELKKKNVELPLELNGLLIMVKKLLQFVKDSHISPIMKIGSINIVKATDVENCFYEGTPFLGESDEKTVKVVSPGWIYRDKDIQISRPKVKEEI